MSSSDVVWHGLLCADRKDLDRPGKTTNTFYKSNKPSHTLSLSHTVMTKKCDVEARPGYDSMLAHEYADTPTTLKEKVKILASLLKKSKHCVAYTGAGISTASGISDYATKNTTSAAATTMLMVPHQHGEW